MSLLNQNKINELAGEIGEENVPVLLDIFLGELSGYNEQLSSGQLEDTNQYLAEISHALKSSAASFGADQLCELAVSFDSRVKQKVLLTDIDSSEMQNLLKQTFVEYQNLCK
ncbi:quorum-sensing phosphorelay protein LuxU [Vibrio sp. 99-70-13A1]|uniref:quorum-sensing phosphorelay protein LuxU n=1 Tax=Vibrio sp. 99-70-13A1 TaxID=2607601 RepID=UPI00149334A9|nr:quorum-sensing phosphorelay protein LuxU [Vibrio sp. 99-70-13A1]NOH95411.1 Hpt domain-containing protein [Vibrio sp. 99-70-13A1]